MNKGLSFVVVVMMMALVSMTATAEIGIFDDSVDMDNGRLGAAGSATFDPATGSYMIDGSGDDIWNEADAGHFLYKEMSGDFVFVADASIEGGLPTQDWIKIMLMARQSLSAESMNVGTRIRRDGQFSMQWRDIDGDTDSKGSTAGDARVVIPQGSSQMLERQGDTFITSFRDDSGNWVEVDRHDLAMVDPIYVGFAVTAHDTGEIATGTATNVILGAPIDGPLMVSADIGDEARLGAAGSASYADGTYMVTGSGDDVWNEQDAFHYAYTEMTGDFEIIADVSIEGGLETQDWIKSMIMARQDSSPGSKNVTTRIRRDGQYSMQWRDISLDTDSKGSTAGDARPVIPQGSTQKLVKSGNVFSCQYMNDAGEWVEVDSHELELSEPYLVGFGVTAHDIGELATGTFANVVITQQEPTSNAKNWSLYQ